MRNRPSMWSRASTASPPQRQLRGLDRRTCSSRGREGVFLRYHDDATPCSKARARASRAGMPLSSAKARRGPSSTASPDARDSLVSRARRRMASASCNRKPSWGRGARRSLCSAITIWNDNRKIAYRPSGCNRNSAQTAAPRGSTRAGAAPPRVSNFPLTTGNRLDYATWLYHFTACATQPAPGRTWG